MHLTHPWFSSKYASSPLLAALAKTLVSVVRLLYS